MNSVYFVQHDGTPVLYVDFTATNSVDELLACIAQTKSVVGAQGPGSLLMLTNCANTPFNRAVASALSDLIKHNAPFVKASAVIGLSGLQKILLSTLNRLRRRPLRTFQDADSAFEWLVKQ